MTRNPQRVALLVGVPLAACATAGIAPHAPRAVTALSIAPYAMHEECVKLVPGDRLDFRFESNQPLAFNLHYREGGAVVIPLSRDGAREYSGIYQPALARDYCLMWEAGAPGALLDYHVRLLPAARRPP